MTVRSFEVHSRAERPWHALLDVEPLRGLYDRLAYGVLCLLLLFAPLAYGAVEVWAIAVVEAGAGLVFLLLLADWLARGAPLGRPGILTCLAIAFTAWTGAQGWLGISHYPYITKVHWLEVIAFAIAAGAASLLINCESRSRHVVILSSAFAFLLSLFAVVQHFSSAGKLYWTRVPTYGGAIFGPYVNRNHYAGLMEMLFPIAMLAAVSRRMQGEKRNLFGLAAVLAGGSVFLSGSRGGALVIATEIAAILILLALRGTKRQFRTMAIVVLLLGVTSAWLGIALLRQRFTEVGQSFSRVEVMLDTTRIVRDHPVAGTGLGTFESVYPRYAGKPTLYTMNAAHNDVLQLFAETGTIGGLLVLGFLAAVLLRGLPATSEWDKSWRDTLAAAALIGIAGLLIHSLFDFNLQIPANALYFCFLCGVVGAYESRMGPDPIFE